MSERRPRQGNPPQEGRFAQEEYPYGYPAQGYNLPFDQPPPMDENKPRRRKVKRIGQTGVVNMGANAGVECNYEDMNQPPPNPFTQGDWGVNEPIIEGSDEIAGKGKINMGINSGVTISTGKRAKEIVAPKEDQSNNVNRPQIKNVKRIANEGDLNMGANSGVECNYEDMNQQPPNPFTQAHWGVNEPIIEGSNDIEGQVDILQMSDVK